MVKLKIHWAINVLSLTIIYVWCISYIFGKKSSSVCSGRMLPDVVSGAMFLAHSPSLCHHDQGALCVFVGSEAHYVAAAAGRVVCSQNSCSWDRIQPKYDGRSSRLSLRNLCRLFGHKVETFAISYWPQLLYCNTRRQTGRQAGRQTGRHRHTHWQYSRIKIHFPSEQSRRPTKVR